MSSLAGLAAWSLALQGIDASTIVQSLDDVASCRAVKEKMKEVQVALKQRERELTLHGRKAAAMHFHDLITVRKIAQKKAPIKIYSCGGYPGQKQTRTGWFRFGEDEDNASVDLVFQIEIQSAGCCGDRLSLQTFSLFRVNEDPSHWTGALPPRDLSSLIWRFNEDESTDGLDESAREINLESVEKLICDCGIFTWPNIAEKVKQPEQGWVKVVSAREKRREKRKRDEGATASQLDDATVSWPVDSCPEDQEKRKLACSFLSCLVMSLSELMMERREKPNAAVVSDDEDGDFMEDDWEAARKKEEGDFFKEDVVAEGGPALLESLDWGGDDREFGDFSHLIYKKADEEEEPEDGEYEWKSLSKDAKPKAGWMIQRICRELLNGSDYKWL